MRQNNSAKRITTLNKANKTKKIKIHRGDEEKQLYFNVLPTDIKQNILIKNNYLAKECAVFWSTLLKAKYEEKVEIDTKMLNYNASNGYLKVVKWLREN